MQSAYATPQWLQSIDAVYALFEDPGLRARYPDLATKVEQSVRLSEEVIRQVGLAQCALSFNGGKDCTVIVHILAAVLRRLAGLSQPPSGPGSSPASSSSSVKTPSAGPLVPLSTVYITCPSPFPILETFIRASQSRYNLDLCTVPGDMKRGLAEYLDGGGEAGVSDIRNRDMKPETATKTDPQQQKKAKRDIKAIFIGTRRTDPTGEDLEPRKWTDPSWPSVERIHLILDWDYADVWAFLRCSALGAAAAPARDLTSSNGQSDQGESLDGTAAVGCSGVPYCLLYDQGYTSLGSTFNTFPNPLLQTPEGDYRPAWQLEDGSSERAGRRKGSVA
ncbi:unnamed protein product [Parajaminaea phylloscopi]